MNYKLLVLALLLVLPFVAAQEVYKQYQCIEIIAPSTASTMNISIHYPNSTLAISNAVMNKTNAYEFNYTFCKTADAGIYKYITINTSGSISQDYFKLNLQGKDYNTVDGLVYMTTYLFLLALLGLFLFIFFVTPYENPKDDDGFLAGIDKKKYLKLFMLTLSYILTIGLLYFSWNISAGILEFTEMANYFYMLFKMTVIFLIPFVAIVFVMGVTAMVKDRKIIQELQRGLTPDA